MKFQVEIEIPVEFDEIELEVLLRDAIHNFMLARRSPEEYVEKGYSFFSAAQKERKVKEVERRLVVAGALRVLRARRLDNSE